MLIFIIFSIGLLFILFSYFTRSQNKGFVDYYLLFCLYYDLADVLIIGDEASFVFSQHITMLAFGIYYVIRHFSAMKHIQRRSLALIFLFITLTLIVPMIHGTTLKTSFIDTTKVFTSFSILPIAFHHYATRGNIRNLFVNALWFTYILVIAIIFFTYYQIDSNYETSTGDIWMSAESLGGILYFGNIGVRGGFTYIGFLVLLFPLFFIHKLQLRNLLFIVLGFLIIIMVLSFKRFGFIIVLLGMIAYIFSSLSSITLKIKILASAILVIALLILVTNLGDLASDRYLARGGAQGVGIAAAENDIRLFEIIYSFDAIKSTPETLLIGAQSENILNISSARHSYKDWSVHNQYAQYLLRFGFIGLISYFLIFIVIFRSTRRRFNRISNSNLSSRFIRYYWLLFTSFTYIFMIAGFIGGLDKVTIRGLVFIFIGAIAGHFYKLDMIHNTLKIEYPD